MSAPWAFPLCPGLVLCCGRPGSESGYSFLISVCLENEGEDEAGEAVLRVVEDRRLSGLLKPVAKADTLESHHNSM